MRWRILVNRVRRGGKLGNTFLALLVLLGVAASVGFFYVTLRLGLKELPDADPVDTMLVWAVFAVAFLFFWSIGLVTDLQRSDAMSFRNLLHLPVSLGWVFLYNYLSSFVSISIVVFMPAMLGLCLAMAIVHGPMMALSAVLVLGFVGMVTALTYHLRGWLARLMEDKRRGRNIVAVITVMFVLLLQVPNLVNLGLHRSRRAENERAKVEQAEDEQAADPELTLAALQEQEAEEKAKVDRIASLCLAVIPVGWLPYGVRSLIDGLWARGILCAFGMLAIAVWSLRRSYRTTLASIVDSGGSAEGAATAVTAPRAVAQEKPQRKVLMVERRLPVVGERTAGIAFASLRSLLRGPETKTLLLSPVLILGIMAFLLVTSPNLDRMRDFAAMMSLGAVTMGLLSINQLLQNQFGLDRDGFRAYVLCPVPRHVILQGKNLGTAPLGVGIGLIALTGLQFLVPLDVSHFLGACLQLLSAYLLLCLVGNMLSIIAPMRLKEHGLKAANAKMRIVIWHILSVLLIPVVLAPLSLPRLGEFLLRSQAWARAVPIYLVLQGVELIAIFLFYRWMIRHQGDLLQEREQRILEVLTRE